MSDSESETSEDRARKQRIARLQGVSAAVPAATDSAAAAGPLFRRGRPLGNSAQGLNKDALTRLHGADGAENSPRRASVAAAIRNKRVSASRGGK